MNAQTRIDALSLFLDCDPDELTEDSFREEVISHGTNEYLVLSDSEADAECEEQIRDSLWAFTPSFILSQLPIQASERTEAALAKMQEELCEDANDIVRLMIGDNLDDFVQAAISADGRGHFLASYDHNEHEVQVAEDGDKVTDVYIYRIN